MKNYFIPAVILFLSIFTYNSFSQTYIGTWAAKENIGSYNLHQGSGERMTTFSVKFPQPFEKTPEILLSVTQVDASSKTNVRYNVEVMHVDKNGLKIKIRTWADTQLFSISGFWLAKLD
jgi:hypothetical protein